MKEKQKNISTSKPLKSVGTNSRTKVPLPKREPGKKQMSKGDSRVLMFKDPNQSYSVSSRIRSIGNSKGVILPSRVIEEAGISVDAKLIIQVSDGVILIAEAKSQGSVNSDLSTWDNQFKNAIKSGSKPESTLWDNIQNSFDEGEWT